MVTAWVTAVTVATAPTYWNKWPNECQLGNVVNPYYVTVIYVPTFILLFAIMCGFYLKIIREARKHAKRLRKSNQFKNDPPDTWKSTQVSFAFLWSVN